MASPDTSKLVHMRFPEGLKARLQAVADADRRSLTDLIIAISSCWLDGKRYQPIPVGKAATLTTPDTGYARPKGRPRQRNESLRESWLIDLLSKAMRDDNELILEDVVAYASPTGKHDVNFPRMVEAQLTLLGWERFTRLSDRASVWLGPEHPARVTV